MSDIRTADLEARRNWLGLPPLPAARPRAFGGQRMYASARNPRGTGSFGMLNGSADTELFSSLRALRDRSRQLVRDAAYARRAREVIQNNVVGAGIGMQAQVMTSRGDLSQRINDAIEREYREWSNASSCHTGGTLHFADLERFLIGQVFEAGEIIVRKHYAAFGDSEVPFALEVIEAERIIDELQSPPGPVAQGNELRMGIEVDGFGRPAAYWLRERHPGELQVLSTNPMRAIRVPADEIIHLKLTHRWPQTRGEPWMHAVCRKLQDMDGYTEAEIVAARGAASYMGFIETDDLENPIGAPQADGSEQMELTPGLIGKLGPGETWNGYAPNRPNSALDPFLRYMLREVAAGSGVSYEAISRDYSQSNYSSSRLSLLDDRDLWRVLQQWFIRNFREPVHREWLQQAVLSRAISEIPLEAYGANPDAFRPVLFKPRGWGWVDPTKEVEAYREAVRCGFTTVSRVIAATADGLDLEDVLTERRRELDLMKSANIIFDTDPSIAVSRPTAAADPAAAPPPSDPNPQSNAVSTPARVVNLRNAP